MRLSKTVGYSALLMLSSLTASCYLLPKTLAPNNAPLVANLQTPEQWLTEVQSVSNEPVVMQWWQQFDDPVLSQIVSDALLANSDVRAAVARLRQAQALMKATNTIRWPALDVTAGADRTRRQKDDDSHTTENGFQTGLDLSWELDLFNRKTTRIELAQTAQQISESEVRAVVLSTIKNVVSTYYEYRGLQQRIQMTEQNIQLVQASLKLMQVRYRAGESSEFDVVRAQGEYQQVYSRVPELKAQLRAALYRLSLLAHTGPTELSQTLNTAVSLPKQLRTLPVGFPADLLRRRPDMMLAEAKIDQALLVYELSVADIYPTLTLNTGLGFESDRISKLLSRNNMTWTAGAFLDWSIFAIKARRSLANADYAQAQALMIEYEGQALQALMEVQTALESYFMSVETQKRLSKLVDNRQKSYRIAKELYHSGEVSFLSVLDAERELVTSKDALVVSKVDAIIALVDLLASLGGGWEAHQVDPS